MAGDWIKVEHATMDKPEVLRAAEMLGIHRDHAIGLFFRYFVWLDKNLSGKCPDIVRNVSKKGLDEFMTCPGFASCLEAIGWGEFDENAWTLRIINAERHNGNTAKNRALDAKRKKENRVREMSGSKPDKNVTREEKRRVINNIVGFAKFWSTWPTHKRKSGKPQCIAHWVSHRLEEKADRIVSHVESMAHSVDWTKDDGAFIPAPLVYLRQERFDAPAEVARVRQREVL